MKVQEYLNSLGSTSEEVAKTLESQGIKGRKKSVERCPVINGIKKFCNRHNLRAYGYSIVCIDVQVLDPICPTPVSKFMMDFDEGKYPELVNDQKTIHPMEI